MKTGPTIAAEASKQTRRHHTPGDDRITQTNGASTKRGEAHFGSGGGMRW
jgi:hypothetical protein